MPLKPKHLKREVKKGGNVLCESPTQSLLTADFLCAHERIDRHGDGAVYVLRSAVFRETHLAEGLADADDGFEVADLVIVNYPMLQ